MKKILIAVFCFLSLFSKGQVYQSMPQYGYAAHRMSFDSTLQIPTFCGVPTLKSNVLKFGAIAFDSCNNRFYFYNPKTAIWDTIKGGGGSSDTTSLSNRINLKLNISDTSAMLTKYLRKIDTTNKFVNNITRTLGKDSIIYFIGSNRYAIKDSVGTNPAPVGYYGAFDDSTTQSAVSINTAYPIKLNRTTLSNAVTIVNNGSGQPTRITINNSGIYNIQFSLQLEKTGGSGNMTADIWLRENGIDVPNSTGKVVLTGSANASPVVVSWNYVINVVGGYYYELMWSTSNLNVEIVASVASSPHPATPSAILTVTQQSGIMAGTGMTALNGLTGAVQTFALDSTNTTFKITSSGTAHTFNIPNASASGVTRGLISNTQYTTFNNKIGSSDTATMLTNYAKNSAVNLKVNISDTASMLTNYAKNSAVNLKVNISDTASMLTKYINLAGTGLTKTSQTIANDLSTGVSGGQSVIGGTAASNSLTLSSTSNATKGKIILGTASAYDQANDRLGIGTTSPQNNFDVIRGTAGTMTRSTYESGSFSYNNDLKIGVYTSSSNSTHGAGLSFGQTNLKANSNQYYPGFDLQYVYGSSIGSNAIRYNYTERNSSGTVINYAANLMQIYGDGKVVFSPVVSGVTTTTKVLINTSTDAGYTLDVNGTTRATQFQLSALNTAPATATSTGTLGEIRIVNGAIYVCVATNTWQRALLTTF